MIEYNNTSQEILQIVTAHLFGGDKKRFHSQSTNRNKFRNVSTCLSGYHAIKLQDR